eukprot:977951-Rhodomonas_salina.2
MLVSRSNALVLSALRYLACRSPAVSDAWAVGGWDVGAGRKRKEERLAVTRMRWGEGYEQGDVARGGWGPGSTQAAPCGTG